MLHSICPHLALVDGDERLAWWGATVFLDINGNSVELTQDESFDLVLGVAEGSLELADITARLAVSRE